MYGVRLCSMRANSSSSSAHWMIFCTAQVPFLCVLRGERALRQALRICVYGKERGAGVPDRSQVRRDALEHGFAHGLRRLFKELRGSERRIVSVRRGLILSACTTTHLLHERVADVVRRERDDLVHQVRRDLHARRRLGQYKLGSVRA